MIRTYMFALAAIVGVAAAMGLIGPNLISAESDLSVFLGIVLVLLVPVYLYVLYTRWAKPKKVTRKRQPKFGR